MLLSGALAAGCRDVVAPTGENDPGATAARAGRGRGDAGGRSAFSCFASEASRPGWWRYAEVELRFDAAALSPDGRTMQYLFRRRGADGTPVRVANCTIPRTRRAVAVMNRWLGASPGARHRDDGTPGDAVILAGDCSWTVDGACAFKPIVAIGSPVEDEPLTDPGGGGGSPAPYIPPSPGTPIGGSGGESDSPCLGCVAGQTATLVCSSVERGATVACTVSMGGQAFPRVGQWKFASDAGAPVAVTVTGPSGVTSWSGTAVVGGRVEVRVTDGAGTRTLAAAFAVRDRGWTWATHAESTYSDGTGEPCLDRTPTVADPSAPFLGPDGKPRPGINGLNLEIGRSCAEVRRMIQPDSYTAGEDGFTVATVPEGPNAGLHYVASARLSLRRASTYNLGLFPGARPEALKDDPGYAANDPVHSQRTLCGVSANWYQFSLCAGVNPESYINAVRNHEGRGTTSHNGHFSAAYDAVADPDNDPMRFFDQEIGGPGVSLALFSQLIRQEFQDRAETADAASRHIGAGGKVGNNWSGPLWLWLPSEGRFHRQTQSN
jgi:hypothetical protein